MGEQAALLPRTVTAIVGGAIFLSAAWAGRTWWIAVLAALALVGASEYVRLTTMSAVMRAGVTVAAVGVVLLAAADRWTQPLLLLMGAVVIFGGAVPWLAGGMDPHRWSQPAALAFVQGIAYVGLPLAVLARWRLDRPFVDVLWVFLIVWAGDVAAYFVGLLFGRHKLAPNVSPGKSWEGAIAGLAASAGVGALAGSAYRLSAGGGVLLGAFISVAAQIGDLFESAMKRRAGVKDSGALLPGHGGVLDRFDAVFFAAPVAYLVLKLWGRL